jgi:hypothetical protein
MVGGAEVVVHILIKFRALECREKNAKRGNSRICRSWLLAYFYKSLTKSA